MAPPIFSSPIRRALKSPTPSTPSKTPPALGKVIDGRIKKSTKAPSSSPMVRRLSDAQHDSSSLLLDDDERDREVMRYEEMMEEKKLFPGSENWTEGEERLFQKLFMRQYSPLLPLHWGMDFRGIPVPDILFATSDEDEPVVYAHAPNGDFKATKAIIRLIDLTASVRAFVQMNKGHQASGHIKKELETYLKWAACDGGYDKLNILSNIMVEAVDIKLGRNRIVPYMDERMRAMACQHRRFWRIGHEEDAESSDDDEEGAPLLPILELNPEKENTEHGKDETDGTGEIQQSGEDLERDLSAGNRSEKAQPEKKRFEIRPKGGNSDDRSQARAEATVGKMDLDQYNEPPPVLYGIFIVNRTVVVLTIDPAKGKRAYVSLQVEINFQRRNQGVWNAITIAIVVCMARDEMIQRKKYFVPMKEESDDDPDA